MNYLNRITDIRNRLRAAVAKLDAQLAQLQADHDAAIASGTMTAVAMNLMASELDRMRAQHAEAKAESRANLENLDMQIRALGGA